MFVTIIDRTRRFNDNAPYYLAPAEFLRTLKRYDIEPRNFGLVALHEREQRLSSYGDIKDAIRKLALDFDDLFGWGFQCSYMELSEWQCFFEYAGRRYGLLGEFRENAII